MKTGWTDTDLWYVSSGEGELLTPSRVFSIRRGDCFLLKGTERYRASHNPRSPLTVFAVHFDADREMEFTHACLRNPLFFDGLCERIITSRTAGDTEESLLWLRAALEEIWASEKKSGGGIKDSRIAGLLSGIRDNDYRGMTVEKMAGLFGSSREHFSRVFRQESGMSPQKYILQRKTDEARSLLRTTNYSINRIAEILEYSDVSFFSKQFKLRTGLSPSNFRNGRLQDLY